MTSRYKDFDAALAERAQEPLTFRLGGRDFTAPGFVPASALLELAALSELEGSAAVAAFGKFLDSVLPPEQHDDFHAVLRAVDFAAVVEVVSWVIEEATGRPLESASSSPLPLSTTGEPTRIVSLSPTETRSA